MGAVAAKKKPDDNPNRNPLKIRLQKKVFGIFKARLDIPKDPLDQAIKLTKGKTKRKTAVTEAARLNRLERLKKLNARVRGQFANFMTQADLSAIRSSDMPKEP